MNRFLKLLISACFIALILSVVYGMERKPTFPFQWRLSVEQPLTHTPAFSVQGSHGMVIVKIKQVGARQSSIRYSIIKRNRWGIGRSYGRIEVSGDAKDWKQIIFSQIPEGDGYRIEIYNYGGCLCQGTIQVP